MYKLDGNTLHYYRELEGLYVYICLMSTILFIDTSSASSLIFIAIEERILAERSNPIPSNHASTLSLFFEELLQIANRNWSQIDCVCVLNGPGSYTGLRISLASAKGICYAIDKPLFLFNKLDFLQEIAFKKDTNKNTAVILRAREGEYFVSCRDEKNNILSAPSLLTEVALQTLFNKYNPLLIGVDKEEMNAFDDFEVLCPSSEQIKDVCFRYIQTAAPADLLAAEPFYLKNTYINKINKL